MTIQGGYLVHDFGLLQRATVPYQAAIFSESEIKKLLPLGDRLYSKSDATIKLLPLGWDGSAKL